MPKAIALVFISSKNSTTSETTPFSYSVVSFEDLGFDYFGPYNGNDIATVIKVLKNVKTTKGPIIVHMLTKKGLGYELSEKDRIGDFHGVSPFDIATGKPLEEVKTRRYICLTTLV